MRFTQESLNRKFGRMVNKLCTVGLTPSLDFDQIVQLGSSLIGFFFFPLLSRSFQIRLFNPRRNKAINWELLA